MGWCGVVVRTHQVACTDVMQRTLHLPAIASKELEESYAMVHTTNSTTELVCWSILTILAVPGNNTCETGAVRQVNGTKLAGRVEVCFNGLWGTVCEFEHWSSLEASVVCRQIGLGSDSSSEFIDNFLLFILRLRSHSTHWSYDRYNVWCWAINTTYSHLECGVLWQ